MSNHVSLWQDMHCLLAFPWQLVTLKYSVEFGLTAWKHKQNYVVCFSVSRDKGKNTQKETSKLFFQNYHYHYGMVECCRNVNFEEMDTECSTGKK